MRSKTTERSLSPQEIESIRRIHDRIRRICLQLCFSRENQKQKLSDLTEQLEQAASDNNFQEFSRVLIEIKSYKAISDKNIQLTQKVLDGVVRALHKVVDCFSTKDPFFFSKKAFSFSNELIQKPSKKRSRPSNTNKPANPIIKSFLESFCDDTVSDTSTSESDTDSSTTDEPVTKRQKTSNTRTTNTMRIFSGSKIDTSNVSSMKPILMPNMG